MPDRHETLTAISDDLHLLFVRLVAVNGLGDVGLRDACRFLSDAIDLVDVSAKAADRRVPA